MLQVTLTLSTMSIALISISGGGLPATLSRVVTMTFSVFACTQNAARCLRAPGQKMLLGSSELIKMVNGRCGSRFHGFEKAREQRQYIIIVNVQLKGPGLSAEH